MPGLSVIIIGAGKGTRMKSKLSKLLHKIGNLELINHVINTAKQLKVDEITVVCSNENINEIKKNISNSIKTIIQEERLGTAHATKIGYNTLKYKDNNILVMYGDVPLIKLETYQKLVEKLEDSEVVQAGLIFRTKDIANKYGRVTVEEDKFIDNTEYKDADENLKKSDLCNAAILAIRGKYLENCLNRIDNNNAAKEYYLTDTIKLAKKDGYISKYILADEDEVMGVNSRFDLSIAEKIFQNNKRKEFMLNGVTLIDPDSVYFSYDTIIENDVTIEPNVVFMPGVKISSDVVIHSFSYLEGCIIENGVSVGPFARIRPGTVLQHNCHIGNFVEIKKSSVGSGTKIGHLTYIGDTIIGNNTNIGAGCITCNYDGFSKFQTKIGNDCFIGSNTTMISPVNLDNGCITGAGSIITKDVNENDIAIARIDQKNLSNKAISYRLKRSK